MLWNHSAHQPFTACTELTAWSSELDPGDGLMNAKDTGKFSIPGFLQRGKKEVKVPSTCWMVDTAHKELNLCPEWETKLNQACCQVQYIPIFSLMFSIFIALSLYHTLLSPELQVLFQYKTDCLNISGPKESRKLEHKLKENRFRNITPKQNKPHRTAYDVLGVKCI